MANKNETDVKANENSKKVSATKTSKKTSTTRKQIAKKPTKVVEKAVKREVVKVVEDQNEMANIMDEKETKSFVSRDKVKVVGSIIFWTIFVVLAFVWIVDYFRVSRDTKPMFCVAQKTYKYDDGKVQECIGLGYKVYTYDRKSLGKGVEFGSFFTMMKNPEN